MVVFLLFCSGSFTQWGAVLIDLVDPRKGENISVGFVFFYKHNICKAFDFEVEGTKESSHRLPFIFFGQSVEIHLERTCLKE